MVIKRLDASGQQRFQLEQRKNETYESAKIYTARTKAWNDLLKGEGNSNLEVIVKLMTINKRFLGGNPNLFFICCILFYFITPIFNLICVL